MGTPEVRAVFDLLYASRDEVSRVTGVRMPSGVDPQYLYGQAETKASLSHILTDQHALAWRAHEVWKRDAAGARLNIREATALLQHLRQVDPGSSRATMEDLHAVLDKQLQQLESRVEVLGCPQVQLAQVNQGLLAGQGAGSAAPMDGDSRSHQRGPLRQLRHVVSACPGFGESSHGSLGRQRRGPEVLAGRVCQEASEPTGL